MAEQSRGAECLEQPHCASSDLAETTPPLSYAAIAAAAVVVADGWSRAEAQTAITDIDILNFLLNLEYLQAQFYGSATGGSGLTAADIAGTGSAGAATGGRAVSSPIR